MKKLLLVAYETRYARCGGITAVMNCLPGYLRSAAGLATSVITPFHQKILETRALPMRPIGEVDVLFFGDSVKVKIYRYDDRWHWYFLDAQDFPLPKARQIAAKDEQFFAGLKHPYDVGTNAAEQLAILRRDSLFFGAAVARALVELGTGIIWTLVMQDWQAATTALALAGPNSKRNVRLFLALHNSYDSGPITPEDLDGVGINPHDVPEPITKCTVLGRAIPLLDKPIFTVSEQFARDFTEDILQSRVMANHLQEDLKPPNLVGVNNGLFASLAVPEKPCLTEARRRNYGPLRDWKRERRKGAIEALDQLRRIKALIEVLRRLAIDDAKRNEVSETFAQLKANEAKKSQFVKVISRLVTRKEEKTDLIKTLDYLTTSEGSQKDVLNALNAEDPKPVWGSIADFLQNSQPEADEGLPWFVLSRF